MISVKRNGKCLSYNLSLFLPLKLLSHIINYFQNLQAKKESEVVNSSTSTDFNASMETTLVVQTTDKEYKEEKSRYVVSSLIKRVLP